MRVNIKILGIIIILFAFLEPDYFISNSVIHLIFNASRLLAIVIAIIISIKKNQFLYVSAIVCAYYGIYLYSTILNDGDLRLLFSHAILTIGFVMWLEILFRNYPFKTLYSLNFIYSILVYCNIIFFLLFPDGYTSTGLVNRYFLGVPNQFAAILIPAVVVSVIYSLTKYNKIILSTKLLMAAVFFTFIYFWSATSLIGISLIIIYLIFIHKGWLKYFINQRTITISMLFLFLTVVYFTNLDIFSFIIEGVLDKDLTLSTRTRIWEEAKFMISESPYFGYGPIEDGRYLIFSNLNERDAHNMVLQILLQSGYFGLTIFILLIVIMLRRISKSKSSAISKFMLFSLFVSTTMMLSEVYSFRFLYLILLLGIFTPNIIKEKHYLEKSVSSY